MKISTTYMYTHKGVSTIFMIPDLAIVDNFVRFFSSEIGQMRDDQETGNMKDGKSYHQGISPHLEC